MRPGAAPPACWVLDESLIVPEIEKSFTAVRITLPKPSLGPLRVVHEYVCGE